MGSGNFVNSLLKYDIKLSQIKTYDIDTSNYHLSNIVKGDFLKIPLPYCKNRFAISNVPYGKRGRLAIQFLNKSLKENDIVCFILPKIFTRYSVQKQIDPEAKLIYECEVEKNAFLVNNREYHVNSVFQIWINSNKSTYANDLRLTEPKPNKHPDFTTYIHNNTKSTLKYFDKKKYKWDFAVHRQGYYDYNNRITREKQLIKNRQYVFIKYDSLISKKILGMIDFQSLADSNTTIKGFSLTDLVEEYTLLKLIYTQNKKKSQSLDCFFYIVKCSAPLSKKY